MKTGFTFSKVRLAGKCSWDEHSVRVAQGKKLKETAQEKEFIAKHGDLRPTLAASHTHGQQYFDSADWSMHKNNAEMDRQLRQLPRVLTEKRLKPKVLRKSTFSHDSAKSLSMSPLKADLASKLQTK